FIERAQFLKQPLVPALVVMLVQFAADRVKPRCPRQDGYETGGPPTAPLALETLRLRVVGGFKRLAFATLVRLQAFTLKSVPRLHRRVCGFELAPALGLAAFQGVDAI